MSNTNQKESPVHFEATSKPKTEFRREFNVEVTPEMADSLLLTNDNFRSINRRKISMLVEVLKRGEWQYRPGDSPIAVDWFNALRNGQHRLTAISESGVSARCDVMYGADPAALYDTDVDPRVAWQHVGHIYGSTHSKRAVAVARLLLAWMNGKVQSATTTRFSTTEVLDALALNGGIFDACSFLDRNRTLLRSELILVRYLTNKFQPEKSNQFFAGLVSGANLHENSPALRLRNALTKFKEGVGKVQFTVVLAYTIKAWNAFFEDRDLTHLSWRRSSREDGEQMPEIAGIPASLRGKTRRTASA